MPKHPIPPPSRRRSATETRRRQRRILTRRQPAPITEQTFWLAMWYLRRGITRTQLAVLTLVLIWSAVRLLRLARRFHIWPVAQVAPIPTATRAWPTATINSQGVSPAQVESTREQ